DDDAARPAGAEAPLAELLGDEQEVLAGLLQPPHDRRLGRGVDRGRVVAALPRTDDWLRLPPTLQVGEHSAHVLGTAAPRSATARVLGPVERFRDRLQVAVRSIESAPETDPATLAPALRRDADELQGFLEFLTAEISHAPLRGVVERVLDTAELRSYPATPDA